MDIIGVILITVFIVAPAIVIYTAFSRIGSGIYHWADRQHPEPQYDYNSLGTHEQELVTTDDLTQDYWIEQSNIVTRALQQEQNISNMQFDDGEHLQK